MNEWMDSVPEHSMSFFHGAATDLMTWQSAGNLDLKMKFSTVNPFFCTALIITSEFSSIDPSYQALGNHRLFPVRLW